MAFLELPGTISTLLWVGVKLTIFFKRSFEFREHIIPRRGSDGAVLILLVSCVWLQQVWLLQFITAAVSSLSATIDMFSMLKTTNERIKSFVIVTSLLAPLMTEDGSYVLPSLSVLCATTQFLRWPARLKDFLREVRIIFGPVYVITVIGSWLKCDSVSSTKLLGVAALCSSIAAIFLRPDNDELFRLFRVPVPRVVTRKVSHGVLMLSSFICMAVHIVWFQSSPWTHYKTIAGAGIVLNVSLFLGAAHSPRILGATLLAYFNA